MATKPDDGITEVIHVQEPNENCPIDPPSDPPETLSLDPPAIRKESKKFFEKLQRPVHILFTGLSGAGKSTLVNVMLGETVAKTGCGPKSMTAAKDCYEGEYEGIQLRVYDTDGYSKEKRIKPKNDIKAFDLILVCIKIINRIGIAEKNLLHALGKAFDKEAWNRTVIVLTFANQLLVNDKIKYLATEEAKCQAMNDLMEDYKESITKHLEGYMDKETGHSIPFCLAGESHPYDPTIRSVRKLPTTEDWLVDLWDISASRINPKYKPWFVRLIRFIRETFFKILPKKWQKQKQDKEQQDDEIKDEA